MYDWVCKRVKLPDLESFLLLIEAKTLTGDGHQDRFVPCTSTKTFTSQHRLNVHVVSYLLLYRKNQTKRNFYSDNSFNRLRSMRVYNFLLSILSSFQELKQIMILVLNDLQINVNRPRTRPTKMKETRYYSNLLRLIHRCD